MKTMNRSALFSAVQTMSVNGYMLAAIESALSLLINAAISLNKAGWIKSLGKLQQWQQMALNNITSAPFTLFMKGNAKLPFYSWSTLPGVNCPGAGSCFESIGGKISGWCYSFKAWRYPDAFARQLQNTIMERGPVYRLQILKALDKIAGGSAGPLVPLRLYVDGDFPNLEVLKFWLDTLKQYPRIRAYGYSKSLDLFKQLNETGYTWPDNYWLNLSSGGKYERGPVADYVKKLPIYRGEFVAVDVPSEILKAWKKQQLTREQSAQIRAQFPNEKIFICPGKCGECTAIQDNPHACGNGDKFQNMKIVIPVH